jgi:hypothetical protein
MSTPSPSLESGLSAEGSGPLPREVPDREIASLKHALATHPLARHVDDVHGLRLFMEHHVVCVLDFMSLLKSLQRDLTVTTIPWVPSGDPEATRLVNELVLGEESDALPAPSLDSADGARGPRHASHFEWYLAAMDEVGCDRAPIDDLVSALRAGTPPREALAACSLPPAAVTFSATTWRMLEEPLAVRMAVFHHSREDLIPSLLAPLVARLHRSREIGPLFVRYMERHVDLDGDVHGPMCARLLARQLDRHPEHRDRALAMSRRALRARCDLWDAVAARVRALDAGR